MKVHFEQDFGREMEAFTIFLQQRSENQDTSGFNNELLKKFAKFLEMENRGPKKCGFDHHGRKHGGFGKHGHHGHHFGKHGFGRHGHGFGRHAHGFGRHGHGFVRHGHGFGRQGHDFGKHCLRQMYEELLTIERDEVDQRPTNNGSRPSPPPKEATNDSHEENEKCIRHFGRRRGGCFGHRPFGRRGRCNGTKVVSTQTEDIDASENVDAMEEIVTIEDSTAAE